MLSLSRICRSRALVCAAVLSLSAAVATAQTNPSALTLPVSQNWGGGSFNAMPAGFASWNGLSGSTIDTQPEASTSAPGSDASILTTAPSSGGTGGSYGFSSGGNAQFGILTSSNSTNGVNQLVMAINTTGQANITLEYDLINVVPNSRPVGTVCQYRIGTGGGWTDLTGTGNPYLQSGGTAGETTHATISLPASAENKPVVQIRWAVWRGAGSGSSSGFAIDNISATANAANLPGVSSVTLANGPSYELDETVVATVNLSAAPDTSATVNVSSGAFATTPVTIIAPETSGEVELTMSNLGNFVATATAVTGCTGSAVSSGFSVTGTPESAFASSGVILIDDSLANGNGYIDPGENNIRLQFEVTNTGTANATGVTGVLTSLSGTASVTSSVQFYPDIPIGASRTDAQPFQINVNSLHTCGASIDLQLNVTSNEGSSTFVLILPTCPPVSDPYDAPGDYYATATGLGSTLKNQLHNIISKNYWGGFLSSSTHLVRSYDAAKSGLQVTDVDPNNSSRLILLYTGISVPKAWDAGNTWNREHQWPDSRGINGTSPAYSDLHNLRPCDPGLNSTRGNSPFGSGSGYFDPDQGSPDRGRVARSMFYMNTRYNGTAPNASLNLVLVNGQPGGSQMGDLAKLLEWNYAYPVDIAERRRNTAVFSNSVNPNYYQGNRNPYVDHPEYVWTIYGSGPNDSRLYVGVTSPGDGASTQAVVMGPVFVNAAMPSSQSVTLRKSGAAPTTYEISGGGSIVSTAIGDRLAFAGGTQTRSLTVGLSGSTNSAGMRTGSLLVDNTDLTTAGAGTGSADGNDLITVSLAILDHARASFSPSIAQSNLTVDFGDVPVGSGAVMQALSVYNRELTVGYTADLDLDSIGSSGDAGVLTIDLTTFSGLTAGSGQSFNATFTPLVEGDYLATYTLQLSDENIAGAQNSNLVLTVMGRVVAAGCLSADLNCDASVTLDDVSGFVTVLLGDAAPCSACAGDLNGDLLTDGNDIQMLVDVLVGP